MNMQKLNLPAYQFNIKIVDSKKYIFDFVRKKFVLLTPEEWVRQNFIMYLIHSKKYPGSLMSVERQIKLYGKLFRFDLLIYNKKGDPFMIAEFKSPAVPVTQETFDQVVRYNMALKVDFVLVSNGMQHFICQIDYKTNSYKFLREVPFY
jgi:hypothetical protein